MSTATLSDTIKAAITEVAVDVAFQERYVGYSIHTLVGRAVPDVRDGLKPVHRRVLYAMQSAGFTPNRPVVKSAKPVAETMGNYHPHGDSAIYDALVRMAQPWKMRMPLIFGEGNFGSTGADGAAAMRYTESRLADAAMALLDGLSENTVDMIPNYDNKSTEPLVLPARVPNLLINGAEGMAVGARTLIPPHNPGEVAEAVRWALTHSSASTEERHRAYRQAIPGPDFPTGGVIRGRQGIDATYESGRGRIVVDGVATVEQGARGVVKIVITEVPFGTDTDALLTTIGDLAVDGRLPNVTAVDDESSDRVGLRLTITAKSGTDPDHLIALIKDKTQLRTTISARLLAVNADRAPQDFTLGGLIDAWIEHQLTVVVRRSHFRRDKAAERRHIVIALIRAVGSQDALDRVVAIIRGAANRAAAADALKDFLDIDDVQVNAILALPLGRITQLGVSELQEELAQLDKIIDDNQTIIDSPRRQRSVVRKEMDAWIAKIDTSRRTVIADDEAVRASSSVAVPAQDTIVCLNADGYLWRLTPDAYSRRNGGADPTEAVRAWSVTTATPFIGIDADGGVHRAIADTVPSNVRKPVHPASLFDTDIPIVGVLPQPGEGYIGQLTTSGHVKVVPAQEFTSNRAHLNGMRLAADEKVIAVSVVPDDATHVAVVSQRGHVVSVPLSEVRVSAKRTGGAAPFFKTAADDAPVAILAHSGSGSLTTATTGGFVKRTALPDLPDTRRNTRGVPVFKRGRTHGNVVGAWAAPVTSTLVSITDGAPSQLPLAQVAVTTALDGGKKLLPPSSRVFLVDAGPEQV